MCWAGGVENGCFQNTTTDGAPVTGYDLHDGLSGVPNTTEYATTLYTTVAERIIAEHADAYGFVHTNTNAAHDNTGHGDGGGARAGTVGGATRATRGMRGMSKPLFLYLPHQAVHVGNKPEESHPGYWEDQAPLEYIERYAWVKNEQRRNLSAMVVRGPWLWCGVVWCEAVHSSLRCTVLHCDVVWCGVVCCAVVWCGVLC